MIFFTSDTHFFHEKMIDYEKTSRSFSSVEEMDEILISNWNSKITDNDIVYHLGDFSFGNEKETCSVLERLNGNKILIRGNHDKHQLKSKNVRSYFKEICSYYELTHETDFYVLSHYPFLTWNKSHYGSINLFGHLHSKYKGNSQQLNVGVDCHNLFPINIKEIKECLTTLPKYEVLFKGTI